MPSTAETRDVVGVWLSADSIAADELHETLWAQTDHEDAMDQISSFDPFMDVPAPDSADWMFAAVESVGDAVPTPIDDEDIRTN